MRQHRNGVLLGDQRRAGQSRPVPSCSLAPPDAALVGHGSVVRVRLRMLKSVSTSTSKEGPGHCRRLRPVWLDGAAGWCRGGVPSGGAAWWPGPGARPARGGWHWRHAPVSSAASSLRCGQVPNTEEFDADTSCNARDSLIDVRAATRRRRRPRQSSAATASGAVAAVVGQILVARRKPRYPQVGLGAAKRNHRRHGRPFWLTESWPHRARRSAATAFCRTVARVDILRRAGERRQQHDHAGGLAVATPRRDSSRLDHINSARAVAVSRRNERSGRLTGTQHCSRRERPR